MASTFSLSNEFSKEFGNEKTSLSDLYFDDLDKRVDSITTERIEKGNTVLGTYKVISDPISGGMGSVWCVHHESWDADLAMKRPQPRYFAEGSDKRKEQFIKECEHWIDLGLHPNIVSCYYVREIGGVPTIFSEWMDGGSLSDRIKDGSLYEGTEDNIQERILDIAIQSARGLQYSHENGLIHQDMKPGNLLLTKDWDAKVADFGLAKAKSKLNDKSDTAKTTGGTLAYCPKEQREGEEPARWMDVYAWALTVLSMYEGQEYPHKNENNDWEYPWLTGAEAKENLEMYFSKCEHNIPDEMLDLLRACINNKPDGFDDIEKKLIGIYYDTVGSKYARKSVKITDSPESMNNLALSYIDLGNTEYAERLLKVTKGKKWKGYNAAAYNYANILQGLDREVYENPIKNIGSHILPFDDAGWLLLYAENRDKDAAEEMLSECEGRLPEQIESYVSGVRQSLLAEDIKMYSYPASAGVLSPSGKEILIVSRHGGQLILIDAETGDTVREFTVPYEHPLHNAECILLSDDGEMVYLIDSEQVRVKEQMSPYSSAIGKGFHHRLYIWRYADGGFIDALEGPTLKEDKHGKHSHRARAVLKDDRFLFVTRDLEVIVNGWDNKWLWDLKSGRCYREHAPADLYIKSSPNHKDVFDPLTSELTSISVFKDIETGERYLSVVDNVDFYVPDDNKPKYLHRTEEYSFSGLAEAQAAGFGFLPDIPCPDPRERRFEKESFELPYSRGLYWHERNKTRYTDLSGDHGDNTGEITDGSGFPRMVFHARQFSFDREKSRLLVTYEDCVKLYPLDQPFTRYRAPYLLCRIRTVRETEDKKAELERISSAVSEKVKEQDIKGAMELLEQARQYYADGYVLEVAKIGALISTAAKPVRLHSIKNIVSEYYGLIFEGTTGHTQTAGGKSYTVMEPTIKRSGAPEHEIYEVCGHAGKVSYFEEAPMMKVTAIGDIVRLNPPYLAVSNSNTKEWIADYPLPGKMKCMVILPGGREALAVIYDEVWLTRDPEFRTDTYEEDIPWSVLKSINIKPKEYKYKVRQRSKVADCLKLYSLNLESGVVTEIGRGFAGVNHREKHSTKSGLWYLNGKLTFKDRFVINLTTDRTNTGWQHMTDKLTGEEINCSHARYAVMSDDGRYLIIDDNLMILDWDWEPADADTPQKIVIDYDLGEYIRFAEEKKNIRFLNSSGGRQEKKSPVKAVEKRTERKTENPGKKGFFGRLFSKK